MANIHWYIILFIVITILGSAVVGAFIYAAISLSRNKKQAIAFIVDVFPAFEDTFAASVVRNHITIFDGKNHTNTKNYRLFKSNYSIKDIRILMSLNLELYCLLVMLSM